MIISSTPLTNNLSTTGWHAIQVAYNNQMFMVSNVIANIFYGVTVSSYLKHQTKHET